MSATFGEVILKICPAKSPIESIVCTSDSQKLIVGQVATNEKTPTLSIVDIRTGNIEKVIEESDSYKNSVWKLVVDKNDNYIIYLKQFKDSFQIIRYNLKNDEKQLILEAENNEKYSAFIIGPNNELVISIDDNVKFIDIQTLETLKSIRIKKSKKLMSDPHCYNSLAISSDGKLLVIGGLNEGKVLLFDLKKEKELKHLTAKFDYPRKITFDPTGNFIFILDYWTHGMFIWDLLKNSWFMNDVYSEHWQRVTCIDFYKKNPKNVVMGMISSVVSMIDFQELEETFRDKIHNGRVYDVFFTPDGNKLVSSGEDWQIIVRNAG